MQLLMQTNADIRNIILYLNSEEDICRYFPDNTTIRKPGSCTETLICNNGKSQPYSKCPDGQMISLKDMKCTTKSKDIDDYCKNKPKCNKKGPKWMGDLKNCHDWHECNGTTIAKSGTCSPNGIFSEEKQACIAGDFNCNKTYMLCNVAPENKPFWDEFNCHEYFYCSASEMKFKRCDDPKHYYDIRSGKCIAKAKVDCYKHPIPDEVCGNKKLAIRDRFVKDQATCRGYFYCKFKEVNKTDDLNWNYDPDLDPKWGQCPMGLFFDEEFQACRNQNEVKCEEDRCDSRKSGKILDQQQGCQSYLVCQDGHTEDVVKCDNGKYFDPLSEQCVDRKISYPICA